MLSKAQDSVEPSVWEDSYRFLGIKIIDTWDFTELILRFTFTLLVTFLVVNNIYAKNSKRKDFYFSYMAIGAIVFLLCFLLNNVKLELGFALGLFAIFGIIRYRTSQIPIKEMTYLFIVIGISVINALASKKISYAELLITNAIIIAGLWFMEKRLMLRQEGSIKLIYEKIDSINVMRKEELLEDLEERTGIHIKRYEVKKIDFMKDVAQIEIFFDVNGNNGINMY